MSDYDNDGYCGFEIVEAREIDTIGTQGIIDKIRNRVGLEKPVYLSIDIDTLDPACKFHPIRSPLLSFDTNNYKSHPQPEPPKPGAGPPANSEP